MKKTLTVAAIICGLALASGCAVSKEEFAALQGAVRSNQSQMRELNQKVDRITEQLDAQRRPQADLTADITALKQELAAVRGQMEETAHRMQGAEKEDQTAATLAETDARLAKVEGLLGIKAAADAGAKPGPKPPQAAPPAPTGKPTDKELYNTGISLFNQKQYDAARGSLEAVLQQYPNSRYAPASRFWVGETYYSQKRFEDAILAYNQVIKKYPRSNKVPAAMLKQGLAFSALGDKKTAKIVLEKLCDQFPKSSQAAIAKKYLAKLK